MQFKIDISKINHNLEIISRTLNEVNCEETGKKVLQLRLIQLNISFVKPLISIMKSIIALNLPKDDSVTNILEVATKIDRRIEKYNNL